MLARWARQVHLDMLVATARNTHQQRELLALADWQISLLHAEVAVLAGLDGLHLDVRRQDPAAIVEDRGSLLANSFAEIATVAHVMVVVGEVDPQRARLDLPGGDHHEAALGRRVAG